MRGPRVWRLLSSLSLGFLLSLSCLTLFEWLSFVVPAAWRCDPAALWHAGASAVSDASFAVVTDVHVLGERRRSSLDRWWTDRQLGNGMAAIRAWFAPMALITLGDNVDEGLRHSSAQTWKRYVERFRAALRSAPAKRLHGTVGNHDAEEAGRMTQEMVAKFQEAFGKVNDVVRFAEIGVEFVSVNAIAMDKCHRFGKEMHREKQDPLCVSVDTFLSDLEEAAKVRGEDEKNKLFRVMLIHMPLNRKNDLDCGARRLVEGGGVTYSAPTEPLMVGQDVLSKPVSDELLRVVQPDLVLSGHTHAQCFKRHPETSKFKSVLEVTIPTFSWRMRPDPSYLILRFSKAENTVSVQLCHLPNEHLLIFLYVIVGVLSWASSTMAVWRKLNARPTREEQEATQKRIL